MRLYARALTPDEDASLHDLTDDLAVCSEIVRLALFEEDGPAFASRAEVGQLLTSEVIPAAEAISKALRVIGPQMARIDGKAWQTALERGALHPSNAAIASAMAASFDRVFGAKHPTPRIDRYYGVPMSDLTYGQRLAFTAAYGAIHK